MASFCAYLAFFFATDSDDPHLVAKSVVFGNLFASVVGDDRVDMAAFSNELVDLFLDLGKSSFKLLGKLHSLSCCKKRVQCSQIVIFDYVLSEDMNTDIFLIAVITGIPISQQGGNRVDQRRYRSTTLATSWKGSRQSSGTANPHD